MRRRTMFIGIRCQLTPAAQRFLDARPAQDRRRFLRDLERRLRAEGSPIIIKRERERPLIAYLLGGSASRGGHAAVLSLVDLADIPLPSEGWLRRVFNLTEAEARLAQAMTRGDALEQVARALSIKMPTARTQLAAIFAKTHTRRQPALVARLTRLASLSLQFEHKS
jgi:DNA-binding CsgD family transcriptional regulator